MLSGMALVVTQAVPRTSAFASGRAVRPFRRPPPPPLVAGACSLRAVQRSPLRPCGLAARQGFPCRRPITASSAAAAAAPPGDNASGVLQPAPPLYRDTDRVLATDPSYRDPALLPPPPDSASAGQVMLYLLRISFGEAQLTWRLVVALALLATSKAAGLASPFYFKRAVDALSSGGGTATVASAAAAALVLTGLCRAVSGIAKEMQGPVFAPVAQDAGRRVSFYTFAHVLGLDLAFHLNRKTGSLSRMLERGARSVSMIFRAIVFTFLPTAVELTAVCVILARSFHPRVSLLVVATFAAYAAWTVVLTRVAAAIRRQVKNLDNEITGKAVDALLNFETVKLFGNDLLEVRQYDTSLTAYQRSVVRLDIAAAALNAGQALILAGGMTGAMLAAALGTATPSAAAVAAAVTAGGSKVAATAATGITAGDLVMIQGLLLHLWAPLQFLGWFYRELRQSLVDMEDLLTLLRTPPTLTDGTRLLPAEAPLPALTALAGTTSATAAAAAGAGSDFVHASSSSHSSSSNSETLQQQQQQEAESNAERRASNGAASTSSTAADAIGSSSSSRQGLRLELRDVSFGYAEGGMASGGGRQVLKGVSLSAEPGESIAIVGPSGGGKSTLLRLLVRLYDADGGQVLLNGVDVRELQQDSLRAAVAVVPQDTVLFNDTIVHNVAYGRPGATWGEVQAAAAAAQLDAAVGRMPLGWQTVVGERGLKLSGGEKQRVAIARAFLRRPRLLICDEATSALDTATERGIQASLRALAAGRTAVFVAHRLSTVQGCDRIYVLADGRVAEQGTHAQLMAARGIYFEMWQMQRAQQALEDHLQQEGGSDGGSAGSGGTSDAPGPSSPQLGERQVPVSRLPGTGSPPAGVETSSDEEGDELAGLAELSAAEAPNRHGRHRT